MRKRSAARRASMKRRLAAGFPDRVTPDLAGFIAELDTAFLATVSAEGAPYIQHRGGPKGFIKVLDDKTLGFADFAGNKQYITISNLAGNDRAYLFLLDFANRQRIKVWGRARVVENDPALMERLVDPGYRARPERAILFTIEAWDVNCSQHITERYTTQARDRRGGGGTCANGSPALEAENARLPRLERLDRNAAPDGATGMRATSSKPDSAANTDKPSLAQERFAILRYRTVLLSQLASRAEIQTWGVVSHCTIVLARAANAPDNEQHREVLASGPREGCPQLWFCRFGPQRRTVLRNVDGVPAPGCNGRRESDEDERGPDRQRASAPMPSHSSTRACSIAIPPIPACPKARGLYDPALDKDSCGVGFIADIKGRKSHQIVEDALTILVNLEHRGAVGADPRAGDGAGILVQIPHKFFARKAQGARHHAADARRVRHRRAVHAARRRSGASWSARPSSRSPRRKA